MLPKPNLNLISLNSPRYNGVFTEEYEVFPLSKDFNLCVVSSNDTEILEICFDYWDFVEEFDKNLIFTLSMKDIIAKHEITQNTILKIIKHNCRLIYVHAKCNTCHAIFSEAIINTRTEAKNASYSKYRKQKYICGECKKKEDDKNSKEMQIKWRERFETAKTNHAKAIQNGVYEALSALELKYLYILSKYKTPPQISSILGISKDNSDKICDKIMRLNLFVLKKTPDKVEPYMESKFKQKLQEMFSNRTKSIFGSPNAQKLYRKLKEEHMFVYPEIPICAFIEKENVEHLFTEGWHYNYFLTCRLDFVVTDPNGMPQFGVEYQGGYHEKEEMKEKDAFKRNLITEAGLEIKYYTYSDIN
jgi:hypothetical protein